MKLNRRRILELGSGSLAVVPILLLPRIALGQGDKPTSTTTVVPTVIDITKLKTEPTRRPLGRAIIGGLFVRELPIATSAEVRRLKINDIIPISGQVTTVGPSKHNPIWYKTDDGWVHSANIQPAESKLNTLLTTVDGEGVWGEITVPMAELRAQADPKSGLRRSLFFGIVFRITGRPDGTDSKVWY